jgi:hemerythrin-like domain-containing protein
MKSLEILTKEHGLIRQVLDNLSLAIEKLEVDERPPREFFEKALSFARHFADKYHHFKEEYVMFGLLAQKKEGAIDAQIDALRYQHERGRNFIAEIANSLEGYSKGEEFSTTSLLENLAAYISLIRRHIHREDHFFYPMVEKELSAHEDKGLVEQFKKEEEKTGVIDFFEYSRRTVMEINALLNA